MDKPFKIRERIRFDESKLAKCSLFQTPRLFCDIYALLPGQAQKVHTHANSDKIYLVQAGAVTVTVGETEYVMDAGEAVLCPAGQAHGVQNHTEAPAEVLVVMTRE